MADCHTHTHSTLQLLYKQVQLLSRVPDDKAVQNGRYATQTLPDRMQTQKFWISVRTNRRHGRFRCPPYTWFLLFQQTHRHGPGEQARAQRLVDPRQCANHLGRTTEWEDVGSWAVAPPLFSASSSRCTLEAPEGSHLQSRLLKYCI